MQSDTDAFWDIVMHSEPVKAPRMAAHRRSRVSWGSVCLVVGALLSVGAGAYFATIGLMLR